MAVANAIAVTISIVVTDFVTIAVAIAHRRCRRPLLLRLQLITPAAVSVVLPSAITIAFAVTLAVGHCRLHHHWPLQLPSPLAITITITIGHFQELLLWRGENCIRSIEVKNAYLILFCSDGGRRTDQSRITD